jgi:hypothetical protein
MQMALESSPLSSVNSCKLSVYTCHFSRWHTLSLTRYSAFQMIMFIGLTAIRARKAELPLQWKRYPTYSRRPSSPCFDTIHRGLHTDWKQRGLTCSCFKLPGQAWTDTDVTGLLACDLNAKNPVWNRRVSSPWGKNLLDLYDNDDFQISAPQCPTYYTTKVNGDTLDTVMQWNVRLSYVTLFEVTDSDHLPILIHILGHVSSRDFSAPAEIHTD